MGMNRLIKSIAAVMLMMVFAVGCTKPDEPNNVGNEGENDSIADNGSTLNGHEFVDLGLPSGTLWATCNVGAESPEEYGDYFAWGETVPKTTYDWNNYKWCNGEYNQLTKYCVDSEVGYNGFIDNLTILQSDDDAATVNWGEEWRMPDYGQWRELLANTTFIWTTQNDVAGCLLTSNNGKSLFLPAAGSMWIDDPNHDVGDECCFWTKWSGNGVMTNPICAMNFCFGSDGLFMYGDAGAQKCLGFSVRPVRTRESNGSIGGNGSFNGHDYVDLGLPSGTLWATCNVGATLPESPGALFAWGETTPKDHYGWDNYKYCNGDSDQLTKYCFAPEYGYNGFTDNLNTLQSDDDAATVNWGDGWTTPSQYQWMELMQYTTMILQEDDEYYRVQYIAGNGNTLTVVSDGSENYSDGKGCWSSSLYRERPDVVIVGYNRAALRCEGKTIRPVRSAN